MANIESVTSLIEKIFFDMLAKNISLDEGCKRLSRVLSSANLNGLNKTFEVSMVNGRSEFLGMSVYPDMGDFNNAVASCVTDPMTDPRVNNIPGYQAFCNKWIMDIRYWFIEIDVNLFDRSIINFTPPELTAMLLHELSHVVYSDKTTEKFYKAYKRNMAQLRMQEKGAVRFAQGILYIIPGIIACSAHHLNIGRNGRNEEYIADKVFGLRNYQEHLVSAINKIIEAYGNSIVIDERNLDKKLDASIEWCNLNIKELVNRRDTLKREIVNKAACTHSKYAKNTYLGITQKLGIGARDRYTGDIITMESIFDDLESGKRQLYGLLNDIELYDIPGASAAIESTISRKLSEATESVFNKKKPTLPSSYDVDAVSIEVDKITSHADRMYVLDLIYNRVEQINAFKESIEDNKYLMDKYSAKIERMLTELDQMRVRVLNKRDLNRDYKVFVKCPEGYEG